MQNAGKLKKNRNRSSLFNDPDIEPRPALAAFTDSDRFPAASIRESVFLVSVPIV